MTMEGKFTCDKNFLYENIILVFPQKGNNFSMKDVLYTPYNPTQYGADELKRAKIDVKTSKKLQLLLHSSM
jgi:hypothetical protein